MDKEITDKIFNDMVAFGECAYKTELEIGKPVVRYVDPISDELRVAIYNAEHRDSAMQIHYLPAIPQAYDGSKINRFHMGFDPIRVPSVLNIKNSLYDRMIGIVRFRLPRRLKKKVKQYTGITNALKRRNLRFYYDAYKLAKYYRCAFKQEGGE